MTDGILKDTLKKIVPQRLLRLLKGMFYGWHGSYQSWEEARRASTGYDDPAILDKVISSSIKVRDQLALYERDSVIFNSVAYSYPLLAGLMWIAAQKDGRLNVLDFGGALGSSYYQNKLFLDTLNEVNWCVIEQPIYVEEGMRNFSSRQLKFYFNIKECVADISIDVALFSSVLQYLQEPYLIIDQIMEMKVKYIIIDRTPFITSDDRITVQKVHPSIYRAKYPCWFFNKQKFLAHFAREYDVVLEFDALDKANIKSEFKGIIFRRRSV